MFLSQFKTFEPPYKVPQGQALDWLGHAHARFSSDVDAERFTKLFHRYGCNPDRIESRSTFLRDFAHENWSEMQIFRSGREKISIDERMAFFKEALLKPVESLYPETKPDFKQWIHVTCTGYASPSVIQSVASERAWGEQIECLHAYHMGCYAALPAIRMARGNLDADILHSELCTLHFDPANHDPEQLVIQSLFADGVIRYRCSSVKPQNGFEVLEMKEVIAPDSLKQMTWDVSGEGFRMTLNREVPKMVQEAIAKLVKPWRKPATLFAIHPGGPRIIDAVKEALELSEEQVYFSREVLKKHGNMSSATLPHVWRDMLSKAPTGVEIISMAFGPGLTLSASLMRKV